MSSGSAGVPALRMVVIDDDPKNLKFVDFILANAGLEIHSASDPEAGLDLIHRLRPKIVLTDLVMPGVQGMGLLEKIVEFGPGMDVILMTGDYSTESAVEAIQKGAADYFPKPFSPERLRQRIALIVEDVKRRQRSSTLENELLENFKFEGITGRSPLMLDLFAKKSSISGLRPMMPSNLKFSRSSFSSVELRCLRFTSSTISAMRWRSLSGENGLGK